MPKILELARFTSPAKLANTTNDTKDTPIKTVKQTFSDAIELALTQSSQPMTVTEVTELLSRQFKKAYDEVTVRTAMKELADQNKIAYRTETKEERALRADNVTLAARSICAKLYWAPMGQVPARTEVEAVPGFRLFGSGAVHYKKYDTKYKTKRHKNKMNEVVLEDISTYETPVNPGQNQMVDYLIEKMVAERVAEITVGAVKELEEARAELARLREFIKSSL